MFFLALKSVVVLYLCVWGGIYCVFVYVNTVLLEIFSIVLKLLEVTKVIHSSGISIF